MGRPSWFNTAFVWVILLGFVGYLWLHRADLSPLLGASPSAIGSITILIVLGWLAASLQTVTIYRSMRVPLTLPEGLMLTTAGGLGSYLPMRAGLLVRARYLKDVHDLGYLQFGGVLGLRTLLTSIAAGSAGLVGLSILAIRDGLLPGELALLFVLMVVAPVGVMLIPARSWRWLPERLRKPAGRLTEVYDELRGRPGLSFRIVVLLWIQYTLLGLRFVIAATVVGSESDPLILMMMAPLAAVMQFVAITPGGLGLREAIMGFVSMAGGSTFADGVFVGTVDRALLLIMIGIFGGLSLLRLWRITERSRCP